MIKSFLPVALLLLVFSSLQAQVINPILTEGPIGQPSRLKMDCTNEAGTAVFGQVIGQSTDFMGDTIYLCFNDTIPLIHNGDQNLSGDPNPLTAPGIGYAVYECQPVIDGPDLATVTTDGCIVFSTRPDGSSGITTVAGPDTTGNTTFFNIGQVQALLGRDEPIQLWFAPMTYDTLLKTPILNGADTLYFSDYETDGMGGSAGPCVDVNVEAALSVVYLKAIEVSNISVSDGLSNCTGSFTISGGLPEFDTGEFYQVDISLAADPNVKGLVTRSVQHGETLEFTAPVPGVYNVTVNDGKSCGASFDVNMSACAGVGFKLPYRTALPGETVCLDIKVENFTEVGSVQFTLEFDGNVLSFIGVDSVPASIENGLFFNELPGQGKITFSWNNAFNNVTLPDDSIFFSVCFDVIGLFNEESPVNFVDDPLDREVGDNDANPYGFVSQDGLVRITDDLIIAAFEQDSVSCPGLSDGGFDMRVYQGIPPYSFTWAPISPVTTPPYSNGPVAVPAEDQTVSINDLSAGAYVLEITDSSTPANVVRDTVNVFEDIEFAVLISAAASPLCFGDSTGVIQADITKGGVIVNDPETAFDFEWSISSFDTATLENLPSGTYSVTVTDQKGCTNMATGGLSQPPPIQIELVDPIINSTCSGSADGSFSIRAVGGISDGGNYTFKWDDLPDSIVTDLSARTNLNLGKYQVTVTDRNGCTAERDFDIVAPKLLRVDSIVIDASCNSLNNGRIEVVGRTAVRLGAVYNTLPNSSADIPYTFGWTGPNGPIASSDTDTSSTLSNLSAGFYTLTMMDQDPAGCNISQTFSIEEPDSLQVSIVEQMNESCDIGNDGAITVAAGGGTPAYQYLWSSGQTDSVLTNLTAGDYGITLTDANSCQDSFMVTLIAPTPPQIASILTDTVSCLSSTDGSLIVSAQAGDAPIEGYLWNTGSIDTTINGLSPGAYIVSVTDTLGCVAVDTGFVVTPPPLQIDSLRLGSPICPGQANGSIAVFASGGTEPYNYTWLDPDGNTSNTAFNLFPGLKAGTYQLTIVDGNNCDPLTTSVTLNDPPSIEVTFTDIVGVSCFEGVCDGQATASALYSDGTSGAFTFVWETGEEFTNTDLSTVSALCPGPQMLVVSDEDMCATSVSVDVPSPEEISVDVNTEQTSCNGFSDGSINLTASGGTQPFSYSWQETGDTTAQIANLSAGTYNAVITDGRGCQKTQIVELSEPDPLMLGIDTLNSQLNVSCSGDNDARVTLTYNSQDNVNPLGANPYTWEAGVGSSDSPVASNLAPGAYSVILTDEKGCQDELTFAIGEPQPIIFSLEPIAPPLCFGDPTVIRIDTITGGSGSVFVDYTFMVDNNGFSYLPDQDATVFAGSHTVTVEDPSGCTESQTVEIIQPRPISVTFDSAVVVVELGDSSAQLFPIIDSDLSIAFYNWTPAVGLSSDTVRDPIVIPPESLEYAINVTDINGCIGIGSVFVELDVNRNFYIPNAFAPDGDQFLNQDFRVFSCAGVRSIKSAVLFDRWGDLVVQSTNLSPNCQDGTALWDGKYNNKLLNPGVYVYLIEVEFEDNITLLYRGDVTLIR